MDDATKFGTEVASHAIRDLKAIGLAVEEASSKQQRLQRVQTSITRSIELGRQAQIANGMAPVDADVWSKDAYAAFNSNMQAARRDLQSMNGGQVLPAGT